MKEIATGDRQPRLLKLSIAGLLAVVVAFGATAASAPARPQATVTITVNTLPIANALPLDLGIKKGFFTEQGIEINKRTLQSGNDVVLALPNSNGEIGYLGWVPMFIARTQGIPLTAVAASEVEGTNEADNWQNILVKGSSSIRTPADLAGKTIAVNALKGVGEVMIKAALKKVDVDPDSVRLLALPFPAMRSALQNGQVDAIWTPEPFLSQVLERRRADRDGAGTGARPLLADRRLRRPRRLGRTQPGPRRQVPRGDQQVARLRAGEPGRDPRPAPGGQPERPAADLEPADRPGQADPAGEVHEGVRRHLDAAEHGQARPELDLRRQDAAGDGR